MRKGTQLRGGSTGACSWYAFGDHKVPYSGWSANLPWDYFTFARHSGAKAGVAALLQVIALRHLPVCGLEIYQGDPTFATCVGCPILASGTDELERLTGKWPGIGISPKSALAALISETVALENVQM